MRIETITGLRGELIASVKINTYESFAIVLRDDPTFPDRPYSTHYLGDTDRGLCAGGSQYDLTGAEAFEQFQSRLDNLAVKKQPLP